MAYDINWFNANWTHNYLLLEIVILVLGNPLAFFTLEIYLFVRTDHFTFSMLLILIEFASEYRLV